MALPEIRLMQGAIVLAEELNFSRASERLHISQPTLSKQIVELESQLGFRLFDRNHQVVDLTDAGRAFVEEAREAVLHTQRAVSASRAIFSGADEILNVGKSPLGDPFLISLLLSIRLPLFPGLKIRLTSHYATDLAQQVLTGALDLALVAFVPDHPKLTLLRLMETPFYVAMSLDDELAVHRELSMEDIHARNWIVHGRHVNAHLHDTIHRVASDRGVRSSEVHSITSAEEAPPLIREHRGVAILLRTGAWRIASDGITMRPLAEDRLRLVANLATRSDSKSRLVNEFVRATSKKLSGVGNAVQKRLPLVV